MNTTTNYNLNQWEDGDVVRREDFNADNAAIDAALKSVSDAALTTKAEIVIGTYTGDGAQTREINLGRKPKAVLVFPSDGALQRTPYSSRLAYYGGLAVVDHPVMFYTVLILGITDNGFQVARIDGNIDNYIRTNEADIVYHYVAVL